MKKTIELLAPAGDMEKLKTAIHFGADAVYFAGTNFGLRAFATNFKNIAEPVAYAHSKGVKAYVTVNIYPRNNDMSEIEAYLKEIEASGADGIIVSDIGIMALANRVAPNLELHISTQANTTNVASALTYVNTFNAKRVVLARELPFKDVQTITDELARNNAEVEVFVHGAMCISYSGRCLLSNYLTGRDSNRGECVQACRYSYHLCERAEAPENSKFAKEREGNYYEVQEDERGTYILNSKDMCLVNYLKPLMDAGVKSFKIEGRMKSPYYLATTINVYRRAIDAILNGKEDPNLPANRYVSELENCSHRKFTTGFMFNDGEVRQNYPTNHQTQNSEFLGVVREVFKMQSNQNAIVVEMRNRFKVGDVVEVLSPGMAFNSQLEIVSMKDYKTGEPVQDAKRVQQLLVIEFKTAKVANSSDVISDVVDAIMCGDIIRSIN